MILNLLKHTLQPASITLQLLLLAFGLVLLYGRSPAVVRWGRRWLAVVIVGYWFLSSPAGVAVLQKTVTGNYRPLGSAAEALGAQAVVMLSAGSRNVIAGGGRLPVVTYPTALRALETARVYRLLGDPLVIVSGGATEPDPDAAPESEAMRTAVIALGVPPHRVVVEVESKNTHDEAVILKRMLAERGISRFVMVTGPLHMARSMATFAAQGLHPVPSVAPLYADRTMMPFPLLPNDSSLQIGDWVIYEWFARAYYWWKGWL